MIKEYKNRVQILEKDLKILKYFQKKFEHDKKSELNKAIIASELDSNIEEIGKVIDKYKCFKHWSNDDLAWDNNKVDSSIKKIEDSIVKYKEIINNSSVWKNPWFVAIGTGIILFVIGVFAGDFINGLREKPDIDIKIPLKLENGKLPIVIDNVGKKTLKDIELKIKSCYMDYNKTYFIEELKEGQKETIEFEDEKTIEKFNKLRCDDLTLINYSEYNPNFIKVYKIKNTGKLLIPHQEFSIDTCGYCFWDILVFSDILDTTFRESTYSPIVLIQTVGDEESYNDTELEYYSSIRMTPFDDRMLKSFS